VFENRVLRKSFGPKREKVIGDRRKLHNGELNYSYLYSSSYITMITSRRMKFLGHVERVGEAEKCM
jgi:hypothetical protein